MDELDAKTLLRRFCFLGSLEPVYVYRSSNINVLLFFPRLLDICKALDAVELLIIFKEVLQESVNLVRRDETLFALATCLSSGGDFSSSDIKWKTSLRQGFPALIHSDNDLFLFCKYAGYIAHMQKRKGFSQTLRKAFRAWYELQPPEAIRDMWLTHRGAHGYSHRALIKLCHINDETIGAVGVITPFFKTCTELLKNSESGDLISLKTTPEKPTLELSNDEVEDLPLDQPNTAEQEDTNDTKDSSAGGACSDNVADEKTKSTSEMSSSIIVSMSKLRTTTNNAEALRIIRKFKLRYSQVPSHLLRHAPIMEALIPSMSYRQLLKCWRNMARFNHFENPQILKQCQTILDNQKLLQCCNIHPINFLLQMHAMGIRGDLSRLAPRKVEAMKMNYFKQLYARSFGQNQATGLRFHITINLQTSYKKKLLKNHRKLSFYDASVALAFGYFKKESVVDVHHWVDSTVKLDKVPWTKEMDIKAAIACCDKITNAKNSQRLINPVLNSLTSELIYDVFVVIVPTSGRGNPRQTSAFLCKFMDRYRENKNPRAKYVIIDMLKFKKSMSYSTTRNENILEICGLDDNTADLINNFVLNRFG